MFLRNAWYSLGWSDELGPGALHPRPHHGLRFDAHTGQGLEVPSCTTAGRTRCAG